MCFFRYIPILIGLLPAVLLPAQQIPFFNQYTWNPRLFNPASQGADKSGGITAAYRSQFQSLDAGDRPTSYLLHADISPLIGPRAGLGLQLLGDQTHVLKRLQAGGFFGYHLIDNDQLRFSLGAVAGILNQHFDFTNVRVSDPLDLLVFNGQSSYNEFNGGPGMALEYRADGGSVFALDVAVPQLFNSDIKIKAADITAQSTAVYDLIPHFMANARFRYQLENFAVEPIAAFRLLSSNRSLSTGLFDLNLNGYFFNNDLLMVGAGLRTGKGGLHFHAGVAPLPSLRLTFSGEWHSDLGAGYEIGISYRFTRTREASVPDFGNETDPNTEMITRLYDESKRMQLSLNVQMELIRSRQNAVLKAVEAGEDAQRRRERGVYAGQCAELLLQNDLEIRQTEETTNALDDKYRQSEGALRAKQAKGELLPPGAEGGLVATKALVGQLRQQIEDARKIQAMLSERCTALRPGTSEMACIRAGDVDCVNDLFSDALEDFPQKPENLFPLQVSADVGSATITYRYPDDAEAYVLPPEIERLAGHIAGRCVLLNRQGARVLVLDLLTDLQEDKNTLGYQPGISYTAEGSESPITYTLIDNETGESSTKTVSLEGGNVLSLEELAVAKLKALENTLLKIGVPVDRITLTVRFNNGKNIYREETRVLLQVKD